MEKLFWIDLEMTGLDIEKEVILECALIVTDLEFKELDSYHAIIKQPQKYIDAMDDWNKKHHSESGLISSVATGKDPAVVERELIALFKKHTGKEKCVLAGNSIGQDRLFINKYWKE